MMTRTRLMAFLVLVVLCGSVANAELQNVTAGGRLEIYGAWYSDIYEPNDGQIRIPDFFLPGRPIGPYGTLSYIRAGDQGNELSFFEQRTRLYVDADFTDHVRGFIELESIDTWGEDFRSDYLTGADSRAFTGDDVELYQAYVEIDEMLSSPLRLRIGRQELEFGPGWLVGVDPAPDPLTGLSFDALRLTYPGESLVVDAWAATLSEGGVGEQDGDAWFYGLYATYSPSDELAFDVYWMWVRDARSLNDTNFVAPIEWLEDVFGIDDYDVTSLHTVGTRFEGFVSRVDLELEAAYQWGDADALGAMFVPVGQIYGDSDASWDSWAGHVEVGYTFDGGLRIRPYLAAAYYGGEDKRDLSFPEWLNPFDRPEASVSFNRLFSSWREDWFIDVSAVTNFWKATAGVTADPTESIEAGVTVEYFEVVEPFDRPAALGAGPWQIPLAPALSFWTDQAARDLGWQVGVWAVYSYSEDLWFEVGWGHFFTGDAIDQGAFVDENGFTFVGGQGKEDADYVYFFTTLEF